MKVAAKTNEHQQPQYDPKEQKYKSLSARIWSGQLDLVKRAAKAKHRSLSDYVRTRLVEGAAEDLGIPVPEFPEFVHGRETRATKLAKVMGIPTRALKAKLVDISVEQLLAELDADADEDERDAQPPRRSEIVPAARTSSPASAHSSFEVLRRPARAAH